MQMQTQITGDGAGADRAPEAQTESNETQMGGDPNVAVGAGPNPHPEPMLQFFEFAHLPPHLAAVSGSFAQLAHEICATLPRNPERTVALRKLLEAKDCAVRARLFK